MKEFDYELEGIFGGLTPKRVTRKSDVVSVDCHNLEPFEDDYQLHESVVDMDVDDYAWGNA